MGPLFLPLVGVLVCFVPFRHKSPGYLPCGVSPSLYSGGQHREWPTRGPGGYITPAVWGVPTTSKRGTKSEVAQKWVNWIHNPCHLGRPQRFKAGDKIISGPQLGKVAITPALWGVPNASAQGTESRVAHKWAQWLHNPCRLGGPQRCRAGDKISSGPQVGLVATQPLPSWGSLMLQSGGQNQKWPTGRFGGYITLAVWGVPNASERGTKLGVAHKWAQCLHNPCSIGGPQCCRAGDKI